MNSSISERARGWRSSDLEKSMMRAKMVSSGMWDQNREHTLSEVSVNLPTQNVEVVCRTCHAHNLYVSILMLALELLR